MIYRIFYTDKAVKDIGKLDNLTKKRIGKKILEYTKNPFNYAIKLTDEKIGQYRFRIGEYRVVFDVDKNSIIVLKIKHRKDAYK